MSAHELFRSAGISQRLFDFLESMLLVILFAPSNALSAAATLDALYFFVLAHQQDFDVRWCKGPVGATLLLPLMESTRQKGCTIMAGRKAKHVVAEGGAGQSTQYRVATTDAGGQEEQWTADAVVLAVGVKALQGIVQASPLLGSNPTFAGLMNLGAIDAIAVRLWLDRRIVPESPSNVLAGFERSVGATFFDLNALQNQYRDEQNSVLEVDFYGASSLLGLSDDQLIKRIMTRYLPSANAAYAAAAVSNHSVVRVHGGVTAFSPGSHQFLPPVITPLPGVFCAGDCVRQGPGSHGAKGLCQEKAYATGLQAGNAAAEFLGFSPRAPVLQPEEDEQHIRAAREAIKPLRAAATTLHNAAAELLP
ncbi:hypothetical protein DUNSADRAFT_14331 [Dunaliella salina]|nr:hypothetical protein DUNSADRAFT_14331 [Dunaliella salina]|eukprot:KAF5830583.1 hypothetical protein DUNSADRAFT_14331 [Dunaliella salina]